MKTNQSYIAILILILTIGFNLILYYPETQILADANDNSFQFGLIHRTNWIWETYRCPLSAACWPNLIDHLVPTWAEGYPLPFYYSHIPQIVIVASYQLLIHPISSILNSEFSILNYFMIIKYLLLSLFPLSVFLALRVVGFSSILAALSSFFVAQFSTDGLYGIDPSSFLWRGYGLTSQLYAMMFFPLGIAFTYKTLHTKISNFFYSILFLTLTTAGHLGMGIIAIFATIPFLFFDFTLKHIIQRSKLLFFVICSLLFLLSYWIIPILTTNNYHMISFWDPIWKFDSYGWYEVVRQFLSGELFDFGRIPVVTGLIVLGLFVSLVQARFLPFALMFLLFFFLYFGRTTWGGFIDFIPGMKEFHQHRFIVGLHLAGIFLIPIGLEAIFLQIKNAITAILTRTPKLEHQNIILYSLSILLISTLAIYTTKQTIVYAALNNQWIKEANDAYRVNEPYLQELESYLQTRSPSRLYSGRPGNWGKDFRIGSTQLYLLFGAHGFDISQFLPETWSPLSENEPNFDERVLEDYDLLNIQTIIAPQAYEFPTEAEYGKNFGPYHVFSVPTSGWFDLVTSPMMVETDKTNFINLVHLWHRSHPRRWKMHPLITVENHMSPPFPLVRTLTMQNELNYQEDGVSGKNIFADFPFVFPAATVSATFHTEDVENQTYQTTVTIPDPCEACMILLKMSFHPNWQATIDGTTVPTYAVFPFFLAVVAPSGTHTIAFTYTPHAGKTILFLMECIILVSIFLVISYRKYSNRYKTTSRNG